MNIEAFKQVGLNDITTSLIDSSDLDFDNCTLPEVIGFLHKMSRDPHTSTLNLAFTEHITNALIKVREEKLRLEASIPRKLEDGWDPMIKIKFNNFSCFALCDVGASTSVMPKRLYDMLDLKPSDPCSFGVRLVDSSIKRLWGGSSMFLSLSMTIMFPLISLLWTLSVSPLVQLFWDVLFFARLVLSLT